MATNDLLEAFRKTYQNFQLLPLITPEELANFRVEYGTRMRAELEQVIEDCSHTNNKVVFAGHRGCGKSTLLADFGRRVRDRYFVVFFSITDMIEMSDINRINILFAIAVQMMDQAEKENITIKESIRNNFYQWFATKTRTNIEEFKKEGNLGVNLLEWIKLTLKTNSVIRDELKEEFKQKTSDLIARVNEIASVIQDASARDILVIIDDLDKVDLDITRSIYYDHIKVLIRPSFRIIYTVPVAAMREIRVRRTLEDETSNPVQFMHVSKFFKQGENRDPDAVPNQKEFDIFRKLLLRRIDSDSNMELIEPEILDQIILKSGGVLRESIRIMNKCCSKCLVLIRMEPDNKDIKINQEILEQALNDLRNDFAMSLDNSDYQILTTIYKNFNPNNKDDGERQKFLDLLHGLYILEYRNSDLWYDVHPIVIDLLNRKGYLLE